MAVVGQHPAEIRRGEEAGVQMEVVLLHQLVQLVGRGPYFLAVQQTEGERAHIFALAVGADLPVFRAGMAIGFLRVFRDFSVLLRVLRVVKDFRDPRHQRGGAEKVGRGHLGRAEHHGLLHGVGVVHVGLAPLAEMEALVHQIFLIGI